MLYHHLLCPLVAFGAFAFLPQGKPLGKTAALVGLIPTGLYGIPAVILNCLRVWDGPYPFLRVWHQPVWASVLWVIVIFGVDFLLLFGTACLYNHFAKKETKTEETSL